MHWRRWIVIGALVAGVLWLIWYGYRPQPLLVDALPVTRGPLRVSIREEGRTRVRERYLVSAPVSGYARRLPFKAGDRVRAGQVLLEIEPPKPPVFDLRTRAELEARVQAAEAAVREAEERARAAGVDAGFWEGELARAKRLLETGDIPRNRYEEVLAQFRRAEAALASAQETVERARAELQAARAALQVRATAGANPGPEIVPVLAPAAGRVLKLYRESEGVVTAGQPLVEIGDARLLEVEVEVLSEDAVRIEPGMKVLLENWGGEQPLEGRVRIVEPRAFTKVSALGIEEQRVLVIVDITSPWELWRRLGDGYRVEASFILWEADDVLQVPASSLFRYGDRWAVFLVVHGLAHRRIVRVGQRNGLQAQILEGLKEGDLVITHPDESIEDGVPVKLRREPPRP